MILGIDVGYSHTKVWSKDNYFSFKSSIEEGCLDVCSSIQVEFEGNEYTIGENNGIYDNELNKIDSINFKLCLYTAIAKAMKNDVEDIELVTGLPAQYYQSQKDNLIKELTNKKITIVLNGKPKRFTITNVIVFPQSAGILILEPQKLVGDVCVVDIGGFTVDISYFSNKKLRKLSTLELGMNVLANSLVEAIKTNYSVSYDILKVDDILDSNVIVKNNVTINIEDTIDKVLKKHAKLIDNRLKGISEYNISKHIFTGGGSLRLAKYFSEELDKDTIYTNAKAFYKIGVEKFGKN
ncbi:ParM/StbA family protein [Clostridium botulinum C]|uniref:ParM/StbA family protein n=1 Tax=Clostridium botulinum TaxID=1491 RepID=UPI001E44DB3F|nr:ParM/StbA family protein [Clostridium botulinum]MCD3217849.1 ParM/StbA family protein [Clostridium botulinum C]